MVHLIHSLEDIFENYCRNFYSFCRTIKYSLILILGNKEYSLR